MRRPTTLIAVLATLLVAAPAHGARTVPQGFFGTMVDGVLLERGDASLTREFDVMTRTGVETIRPVLLWADMQPTRDGAIAFAPVDRVFAQAARKRLRILPVVLRAPEWARIDPANFASPPRDPKDFGAFLTLLVARYGPSGSFWAENPGLPRNVQRDWEVWNEPNLDRYWSSPEPFPKRFAALTREAYRALKAADPKSRVVLAAMGNDSWRALKQLYAGGLSSKSFDAVAVHPFSGRLANVLKIVRLNHDELRRHGDHRKPLLISEITWPSALGKTKNTTGFETTEAGQATRLRNVFRAFMKVRRQYRIEQVIWSTWLTPDADSPNSFDWSGLRKVDPSNPAGEPINKPAHRAFRDVALPAAGRGR